MVKYVSDATTFMVSHGGAATLKKMMAVRTVQIQDQRHVDLIVHSCQR